MTVPRRRSIESTRERIATEAGTDSATRARPEMGDVFKNSNDRSMTCSSRGEDSLGLRANFPLGPRDSRTLEATMTRRHRTSHARRQLWVLNARPAYLDRARAPPRCRPSSGTAHRKDGEAWPISQTQLSRLGNCVNSSAGTLIILFNEWLALGGSQDDSRGPEDDDIRSTCFI